MATVVLPQLQEAEAQLAAEEVALNAQLAEIQEKIKGIQTVIAMFNGSPDSNGAAVVAEVEEEAPVVEVVEPVEEEPAPKKAVAKKTTAKKPGRPKKTTTTAKKVTAKKATATKKATEKKAPATKAATKKTRGKAASWQSYVFDQFSNTPLPDVVENILKAKPKAVFKISAVMSELFPEDMPKNHFLKARNRISNILSAGARTGEWHRGRGGTYSCTEKSLQA